VLATVSITVAVLSIMVAVLSRITAVLARDVAEAPITTAVLSIVERPVPIESNCPLIVYAMITHFLSNSGLYSSPVYIIFILILRKEHKYLCSFIYCIDLS